MATSEYPQNKPESAYDKNPWGKTIIESVEPPNDYSEGQVVMSVIQYDSRTAERIGDVRDIWNLKDLYRQRDSLAAELESVTAKIAYVEPVITAEVQRRAKVEAEAAAAEAARLRAKAEEDAAAAAARVEALSAPTK